MQGEFERRRAMRDPLFALPSEIGTEITAALRDSLDLDMPALFLDTVGWAHDALEAREIPQYALPNALDAVRAQLAAFVVPTDFQRANELVARAKRDVQALRPSERSHIDADSANGQVAHTFLQRILESDESGAMHELLLAVASGAQVIDVFQDVLAPVLEETGRLWQRNEITVAQEHVVTAAVERAMAQLVDLAPPRPHREFTMASAAVGRNQHQVGARMVADAFALCGWNATYLGSTVPIDDLLGYVDRNSIDVLALSAAIPRDVIPIREFIAGLQERPLAPIVLVGGRPFRQYETLWRAVGADGFAATPLAAVAVATDLVTHDCRR